MRPSTLWILALVVVILAATAAVTVVLTVREVASTPVRALEEGGETLVAIARAFNEGSVEYRFASFATDVTGSQYLQFATLRQHEVFERIDSASTLWGRLQLPDVIVEASAPVEYTYYLDLEEPWLFEVEDGFVHVTAPRIHYNEPAIDASRMEYRVKQDSLVRDTDEAMESLRRIVSTLARRRAAGNIDIVRETGRRRVENFTRTWLVRDHPGAASLRIDVRFVDEPAHGRPAVEEGLRQENPTRPHPDGLDAKGSAEE